MRIKSQLSHFAIFLILLDSGWNILLQSYSLTQKYLGTPGPWAEAKFRVPSIIEFIRDRNPEQVC